MGDDEVKVGKTDYESLDVDVAGSSSSSSVDLRVFSFSLVGEANVKKEI